VKYEDAEPFVEGRVCFFKRPKQDRDALLFVSSLLLLSVSLVETFRRCAYRDGPSHVRKAVVHVEDFRLSEEEKLAF
jgi:hypothetical protein